MVRVPSDGVDKCRVPRRIPSIRPTRQGGRLLPLVQQLLPTRVGGWAE